MEIFYTGEIEVDKGFTWIRSEDDKRILIDEAFFKALGEKEFLGRINIEITEIPKGLHFVGRRAENNA